MPSLTRDQTRTLITIGCAELFVMTLWFSGTAISPHLTETLNLTPAETTWLTNAVQLGFVTGALLLSALTISDVIPARILFCVTALTGAGATLLLASVTTPLHAIALRYITGITLAGVYPTGMKMMSSWFDKRRGLAISVLVGALTVGSAAPHLIQATAGGIANPDRVLYATAAMATAGGVLALTYRNGPHTPEHSPFNPAAIKEILTNKPVLLANLGYFGHMWELYAVWTTLPLFITASLTHANTPTPEFYSGLITFGAIAIGGLGAYTAGKATSTYDKPLITIASLAISGTACLLTTILYGTNIFVLTTFALIWGFAIVADSALFSTLVSEHANSDYVGSALTIQTALGFFLTIISIHLTTALGNIYGWHVALAPLAIGPLVAIAAMITLRNQYTPTAS